MNWVDWAIIIVLAVNLFDGLRKGFITSFFGFVGMISSIFISVFYHKSLADYLNSYFLLDEKIRVFLEGRLTIPVETINLGGEVNLGALREAGVPPFLGNLFKGKLLDGGTFNLAALMSDFFVNVISFFIIFLVIRFIFSIIILILNQLIKTGGLSGFNRLLGMAFGGLKGAMIIMVIITLAIPFLSLNPTGFFNNAFNSSVLGKYFYLYNFIPPLLANFSV